jgi:hypothetical protein
LENASTAQTKRTKLNGRGVVIGEPHPGWYLVQLFEWASEDPSVQRLVPIEKMISWVFYPNADAMTGSKHSQHQITEPRQAA